MTEEPKVLSIGELLQARRIEKGMTVSQLAKLVSAPAENITQHEAGVVPPPELRKRLKKALDLKTKEISAAIAETVRQRKQRKLDKQYCCCKNRKAADALSVFGCCPCKNAKLSSVEVLLRRCREEKRSGSGYCKRCVVLESKGAKLANGIEIVPLT